MNTFRIALANLRFPSTPDESVTLAGQAIAQASRERADIVCFPECFVPGYRGPGKIVPPPNPAFLERAWSTIASAAAKANVAVVLGTERIVDWRVAGHCAGNRSRWNHCRLPGQGPTRPLRRRHLFIRLRTARVPNRSADIRCRHLPRRLALSRNRSLGRSPRGTYRVSTLTSAKPSPAVMCLPLLVIQQTHSMRRQPCAGPPKIPATSPP